MILIRAEPLIIKASVSDAVSQAMSLSLELFQPIVTPDMHEALLQITLSGKSRE